MLRQTMSIFSPAGYHFFTGVPSHIKNIMRKKSQMICTCNPCHNIGVRKYDERKWDMGAEMLNSMSIHIVRFHNHSHLGINHCVAELCFYFSFI